MKGIKSRYTARCEEVIIYEETLGDGKEEPYRRLLVVRAKDGTFIAERDVWEEECRASKSPS